MYINLANTLVFVKGQMSPLPSPCKLGMPFTFGLSDPSDINACQAF